MMEKMVQPPVGGCTIFSIILAPKILLCLR